jgi:hypothetical protein
MAKKKTLPKYEDWKAPWEVDADGKAVPEEDQQFDAARARKRIYDLLSDRERAQVALEETTERAEETEKKLAEATDPKALEDLRAEAQAARAEAAAAKKGGGLTALKFEIALEKGLTKRQALRLVGETRDELEEDADELLEDLGGSSRSHEEGGDDGRPRIEPRRSPRGSGRNSSDPDPDADPGKKDPTPEEVMKDYMARR